MNIFIQKLKIISNSGKYFNWYAHIINTAIIRADTKNIAKSKLGYVESHHILPKSFKMGGISDKENIVYVSAREHFILHCLLVKMTVGEYQTKMQYALNKMKNSNPYQKRYLNSRLYESLKIKTFKYIKIYKGEKVIFVHNDNTDKLKELITQGWSLTMTNEYKIGRVGMMKGRKHTDASKKLMSINSTKPQLGKNRTSEEKQRISNKLKGRIVTDDTKKKLSESFKKSKIKNPLRNVGENNPMFNCKLVAIFNPTTLEQRRVHPNEIDALIIEGWECGIYKNRNRQKSEEERIAISERMKRYHHEKKNRVEPL